jgi:lysophospholipase L1-like esterase
MASQQYLTLMISPPPIINVQQNTRTKQLCEEFFMICQELKIPFLDIFTPLSQSTSWQEAIEGGDGAHPGAEGYAEIARLIQSRSVWTNWFNAL